jgi:endonuclease YncB( thermonuclease family)
MSRALPLSRFIALIAALGSPSNAMAGEILEGPVAAMVKRVVDGDTLAVRAKVWLGQEIVVLVRLRGIDAPELRGDCADEIARAGSAAAALASYVGAGPVTLRRIQGDKYFGRVVADVMGTQGNLSAILLRAGLARSYEGGTRGSWCAAGVMIGEGEGSGPADAHMAN